MRYPEETPRRDPRTTGSPMDVTTRERTHTWSDPRALAAEATGRDGLAFLQAMADGTLPPPPIMTLVGGGIESVERGRVVFTLDPAEYHYNPIGSVHGGVYATFLDSATGCAVQSTLEAGVGYTSLDLSVKFLRRLTADSGTCRATGHVVHAGRRTALARAELVDGAGRLVAEATSSCLILPG
ncbi:PaaI family thioesterase [Actinomycetospora lemnae]|uniref:PaaI family thioesterase n=1 Tax=Actinomycetospora lemnae TaxID=3019891 RepID=A0ABT5SQI2_9PSEU|nr:PaaI family thioesterase [Actinomycetospora sp. DW7H6]MDD7965044.1 PaaI family thioesterase [Actinomycetospora sp. DW7H6]